MARPKQEDRIAALEARIDELEAVVLHGVLYQAQSLWPVWYEQEVAERVGIEALGKAFGQSRTAQRTFIKRKLGGG